MDETDDVTARDQAVERVRAGERLTDVAARFNIAPDRLIRWAGVDAAESGHGDRIARPTPVTILDLAEHTGLSKSVVSRALRKQYGVSKAATEKVAAAAAELGYVSNAAAQRLSSHRTNTIGVLVRDASAAFYGEMQSAIQRRATTLEQRVFITSGALDNQDEVRALEDLIALRVDGLIICSGRLPLRHVSRFATTFPVVVAGRADVDDSFSSVYGDEDAGSRDLAHHLVDRGHREVGVLEVAATVSPALHRRAGVMAAALRSAGATARRIAVDSSDSLRQAPADPAWLVPGLTAVMAPNDRYAVALLGSRARERHGLAITGFDGLGGLADDLIGLTTWRQPIEAVGGSAVDQLLALSTGHPITRQVIPGSLIIGRTSTE